MKHSTDHLSSPRLIAVLLLVAFVAASCGGGATEPADSSTDAADLSWGPLAVVAGGAGSDNALISGTIHVRDGCVLLDEQGEDVLLVWPSERTSWKPATEVASFEARGGAIFELHDGDTVSLAGGGSSVAEGGLSAEDFLAAIDWVAEPDPTCVPDIRWFVGDVVDAASLGDQG